jgi:hypothetical protein
MPELSKEKIIKTYQRLVTEHGGQIIGMGVFTRESGIPKYYWTGGYWSSWTAFQAESGFEPNSPTEKTPDEVLLRSFIELALELKKIPTEPDRMIKRRSDSAFPDKSTFRRWGGQDALIQQAIEYCQEHDEFKQAISIFRTGMSKASSSRLSSKEVKGFVYLIRSGKKYKIGRTNAAGRRLNELSIQLPIKPDTVHVIETDDPEGIELYWHKRFAEKREGGEWFSLTKEDVAAFKRRSYQ